MFLPLKMLGLTECVCMEVPCPKREVYHFEHKDFVLTWEVSMCGEIFLPRLNFGSLSPDGMLMSEE